MGQFIDKVYLSGLLSFTLAGCAVVPSYGPDPQTIINNADTQVQQQKADALDYDLIPITKNLNPSENTPPKTQFSSHIRKGHSQQGVRTIAIGDQLNMTFWEGGDIRLMAPADQTATKVSLNVDRSGNVIVPFLGEVSVANLSVSDARKKLIKLYATQSVNPEVTLSVANSQARSASILGDVKADKLVELPVHDLHLLELIAMAGGIDNPPWEVTVQVLRAKHNETVRYLDILDLNKNNLKIEAGDTVNVKHEARVFSVFGAVNKPGGASVQTRDVSIFSLLSAAGGLRDDRAEPGAVFIFRDAGPNHKRPRVYQLDLRNPESLFLGSRFLLQNEDVVYVGTSDAVTLNKFLRLLINPISTINGF